MSKIIDWLIENKQWVFSGVGATIVAIIFSRSSKVKKVLVGVLLSRICIATD